MVSGHSVVNLAECVLRCIDHVQKAVIIFLMLVDLAQCRTVADQRTVIDEEVEGFVWMQLKTATAKKQTETEYTKKIFHNLMCRQL